MSSRAFSYTLFFSFHLYIIYAHDNSESSENISTPLKFLDQSNGVQKGNHQVGMNKLKKHLTYLGYMINCPKNFINQEKENSSDKCLELALKKYQKFYHLKITGVLDDATIKIMHQPRCGMPDFYPAKNTTPFHEHYAFVDGPFWEKNKLTYGLKDVNQSYKPLIERALRQWASVTHFKFVRAMVYWGADIRISFKPPVHNDNEPFTGDDASVLGHTLYDGRIHFNAAMDWSKFDIESVALHELGHALGLGHSNVRGAIMYPGIGPGVRKGLHQDDIDAIRALYHQ